MITDSKHLPKGITIVSGGVQMGTPLLEDLFSHDRSQSRFNEEAHAYLLKKVQAYRKQHEDDFSCGVALRIVRGTRIGYEPYDLDIKCENYIAQLLAESIKA